MPGNNRLHEKLQKVDIVEIVLHYLGQGSLKQRGFFRTQKFVGLCPFHREKTSSFFVYPKTNSFCCFGCGEDGGVLHFVQRYTNLDTKGALEAISKITGISLIRGKTDPTRARRRDRKKTRALRREKRSCPNNAAAKSHGEDIPF